MKKTALLLVFLLLLTALFSGCNATYGEKPAEAKKTEGPLRVCVDLSQGGFITIVNDRDTVRQMIEGVFSDMDLYGGPEDIEIEVIPSSGAARQTMMTRVQTEIMSGGGPDVFICNCANPSADPEEEGRPLFPFPQKAMESKIFLPLDEYIPKAQYMEWDALKQTVMEAGKTDEGQVLMPLVYSFPLTIFRAKDVSLPDKNTTWDDAVSGEDPALAATVSWIYKRCGRAGHEAFNSGLPWSELADYKTDSLAITQEELKTDMSAIVSVSSKLNNKEITPPAHFYDQCPEVTFSVINPLDSKKSAGIDRTEDLTFLPVYGKEGGAAVFVRAFAGVNRNTKRPEDAFFLIDMLLSKGVQENAALFHGFFWSDAALPVYDEDRRLKEDFTEENYVAFRAAKEQIAQVRFSTPFDQVLKETISQCRSSPSKLDSIVEEAYREMEMMVAES